MDGKLRWQTPPGRWTILRMGYVVRPIDRGLVEGSHCTKLPSWPSPSWEIDPMSARAMDLHWAQTGSQADRGCRHGGRRIIEVHSPRQLRAGHSHLDSEVSGEEFQERPPLRRPRKLFRLDPLFSWLTASSAVRSSASSRIRRHPGLSHKISTSGPSRLPHAHATL